jgi:hypothetical protein
MNEWQAEENQARYTPLIIYTCLKWNIEKVNIRTRVVKEERVNCSRLPGGAFTGVWPLPSGPNCPIVPAASTNHDPHNLSVSFPKLSFSYQASAFHLDNALQDLGSNVFQCSLQE